MRKIEKDIVILFTMFFYVLLTFTEYCKYNITLSLYRESVIETDIILDLILPVFLLS